MSLSLKQHALVLGLVIAWTLVLYVGSPFLQPIAFAAIACVVALGLVWGVSGAMLAIPLTGILLVFFSAPEPPFTPGGIAGPI